MPLSEVRASSQRQVQRPWGRNVPGAGGDVKGTARRPWWFSEREREVTDEVTWILG